MTMLKNSLRGVALGALLAVSTVALPSLATAQSVFTAPERLQEGSVSFASAERGAPVLAGGNTAVLVTSKERPLPAVTLGEVLATSDVPGGVVNVLTGDAAEIGPWLAEHADVDAIDLCGAPPGRLLVKTS